MTRIMNEGTWNMKKPETILKDWIVCGRLIGRASGWDQSDTFAMMVYDLEGAASYAGPQGDVLIDFQRGSIESFDADGNVLGSVDLISAISSTDVAESKE